MKQSLLPVFFLLSAVSCYQAQEEFMSKQSQLNFALGVETPVVISGDELAQSHGRLVTLKGVLSDTKIPRILGVEVRSERGCRGLHCYATGVLIGLEQPRDPEFEGAANSNPDVVMQYTLYSSLQGDLAVAKANPEQENMDETNLPETDSGS